jgi:hypothetical protein
MKLASDELETRGEGRVARSLRPNFQIPLPTDRNMRQLPRKIDPNGTLRQITVDDLPVGQSVDEVPCLVQAFQFTVSPIYIIPQRKDRLGWERSR